MAETFDSALSEENRKHSEAEAERLETERLEDERMQLQAFADWMNEQHHFGGAIAEICAGTPYVEILYSGRIGFIGGKIQFPIASRTLWQCLWAIYKKEMRVNLATSELG